MTCEGTAQTHNGFKSYTPFGLMVGDASLFAPLALDSSFASLVNPVDLLFIVHQFFD